MSESFAALVQGEPVEALIAENGDVLGYYDEDGVFFRRNYLARQRRVFDLGDVNLGVGDITRVTSPEFPCPRLPFQDLPVGTPLYMLEAPVPMRIAARPEWLEPYWEGKESSDQTLTEILDSVRGVKAKERAE